MIDLVSMLSFLVRMKAGGRRTVAISPTKASRWRKNGDLGVVWDCCVVGWEEAMVLVDWGNVSGRY